MKPLALDLCCGKGGWTNGLLKAGWDVIGVDIEDMGGYPSHQIFADVREIAKDVEAYFPALKFDLVVASPPCQEFSYRSFPFKRCRELAKNVPPDKTIWESCERIARELRVPYIIENVRGAQPYMGKAKFHNGAFYFWGDVPALMPTIKPRKGFGRVKTADNPSDSYGGFDGQAVGAAKMWKDREYNALRRGKGTFTGECEGQRGLARKELFKDMPHSQSGSKSNIRKEWSAKIAMIPEEIGEWIGKCFFPNDLEKS